MDEIRTETRTTNSPFKRWAIDRKNAVKFSENPKFRIAGKNVEIKEYQNNSAIDCNIYEVIEKYRGDLKMTAEQLNVFHNEINDTLTNIKNMPDALMAIKEGEEAWKNLPMETRNEFGNSINRFLKNGNSYFEKKINEYNKKLEEIKKFQKEQEEQVKLQEITKKGDVNNG